MTENDAQNEAWRGHMATGSRQFQQGNLEEAALSFNKAIKIFPDRDEAWINIGSSLLQAGQIEEAATALNKAVSINNQQPVSHMLLGDAFRLLGRRADALQCYRNSVTLHKNPVSLNKLACELRVRSQYDEAEELYQEALQLDPDFTLAQVNQATLLSARGRYQEALEQLEGLATRVLPADEQSEVNSVQAALSEYFRLSPAINIMLEESDLEPLETLLSNTPESVLTIDNAALKSIESYHIPDSEASRIEEITITSLPEDWPEIEAMHMIPIVHSPSQYRTLKTMLDQGKPAEGKVFESMIMAPAIRAARQVCEEMSSPIKAELHLRHWHALSCNGIEGMNPGHFKYTQNWSGKDPSQQRVAPEFASGTLRYAVSNIFAKLPPGLERAAMALLIVGGLHPYADGNGRVALVWLNRELELAGLMPAIFPRELGFSGRLRKAMQTSRTNGGDLTPFLLTIVEGQKYAQAFVAALDAERQKSSA